jgi:GNAT superfamily N-acetyltransferase
MILIVWRKSRGARIGDKEMREVLLAPARAGLLGVDMRVQFENIEPAVVGWPDVQASYFINERPVAAKRLRCDFEDRETAVAAYTFVVEDYRNQGFARHLMSVTDHELANFGFKYVRAKCVGVGVFAWLGSYEWDVTSQARVEGNVVFASEVLQKCGVAVRRSTGRRFLRSVNPRLIREMLQENELRRTDLSEAAYWFGRRSINRESQ